jgi:hypothetical protein
LTTVEQRLAFLRHAVNLRLQAYGIPEVGLMARFDGDGSGGQYTVRQNEIAVTQSLLEKPALTRDDVIALADVIRHEVEHNVQWVDMARVLAARGSDATQIAFAMGRGTSLQVADRVATWAVAQEAAGHGIDLSSPPT